ncbi:hypothetical protein CAUPRSCDRAFT_13046 [Caulochytrium protostelioides]|uniref:Uncharacterized protein n=1 Tax=Caulochytrium protostelioides TaxID=1555241 RepID=A0A4P9WTD3_9FUNG|nr:hypothetical protein CAUPRSCDRAFT_13046 [Caulochytrium protostelioides]
MSDSIRAEEDPTITPFPEHPATTRFLLTKVAAESEPNLPKGDSRRIFANKLAVTDTRFKHLSPIPSLPVSPGPGPGPTPLPKSNAQLSQLRTWLGELDVTTPNAGTSIAVLETSDQRPNAAPNHVAALSLSTPVGVGNQSTGAADDEDDIDFLL